MDRWIEDTQMFQRIAGVAVTSREDLEADWNSMRKDWRGRAAQSTREHRIIQDAAIRAGRGRHS